MNSIKMRQSMLRSFCLILLWTCMVAGCSREPVVASVDGEDITAKELIEEAKQRGVPLDSQTLQQLLEVIIDRNAAAVKADAMDLEDDPEFRRAYRNLALETLKSRYRLDWEKELTVSEAEIKAEYENEKARYTVPEKIRIAIIIFENETQPTTVAQDAYDHLQSIGKGDERDRMFQNLAVNYSLDRASRYRGGDVGFIAMGEKSRWPDAVQSAAFALKESGDVSKLIEADGRRFLIKLESRQLSRVEPLKVVKEGIRQRLLTARFDEIRLRTQTRLREDINIKVFPKVLATLESSTPTTDSYGQTPSGPALN